MSYKEYASKLEQGFEEDKAKKINERWLPPCDDECGWFSIRPKTSQQLHLMKDALVIHRLKTDEQKRKFVIDVNPQDADKFLKRIKDKFREKKNLKEVVIPPLYSVSEKVRQKYLALGVSLETARGKDQTS